MNIYLDLFLTFAKIGAFTFGGGYAMLPMFQRELNEKKHWVTEQELIDCYAIGQCTPGVMSVNTATYVGFKTKGVPGAICSTLGIVIPSIIIITIVAAVLGNFYDIPVVSSALSGIRVAVCALVTLTVYKLIKNNVKDVFGAIIVVLAFVSIVVFNIYSVYVVICSAALGVMISVIRKNIKKNTKNGGDKE